MFKLYGVIAAIFVSSIGLLNAPLPKTANSEPNIVWHEATRYTLTNKETGEKLIVIVYDD